MDFESLAEKAFYVSLFTLLSAFFIGFFKELFERWRKRSIEERFFNEVTKYIISKRGSDKKGKPSSGPGRFFVYSVVILYLHLKVLCVDVFLSFLKVLSFFYGILIGIIKFSVAFYAILFLVLGLVYLCVYLGVFISENSIGLEVRDISYGIGVIVISCLSYLATETNRNNKKFEMQEKKVLRFKEFCLSFLKEVDAVQSEIKARKPKFLGFGLSNYTDFKNVDKDDVSLGKVISAWRGLESTFYILNDGRSNDEIWIKGLKEGLGSWDSEEVAFCFNKNKIINLNSFEYERKLLGEISDQYKIMEGDKKHKVKNWFILMLCWVLGFIYIGLILERGGIVEEYGREWGYFLSFIFN